MKNLTSTKAIRAKCLDCCCGSTKEVKECIIDDCPLYLFRFGKNPSRKGVGSVGNLSKGTFKAVNVSIAKDTQENPHSIPEKMLLRESGMSGMQQPTNIDKEGSRY